mmetsp:Transcript_17174/g.41337  ORF Transcript_17174/g.41337 Transcript_17174/m.41337 type:complete len:233 (-) Transcript_17174:1167-1865(-)
MGLWAPAAISPAIFWSIIGTSPATCRRSSSATRLLTHSAIPSGGSNPPDDRGDGAVSTPRTSPDDPGDGPAISCDTSIPAKGRSRCAPLSPLLSIPATRVSRCPAASSVASGDRTRGVVHWRWMPACCRGWSLQRLSLPSLQFSASARRPRASMSSDAGRAPSEDMVRRADPGDRSPGPRVGLPPRRSCGGRGAGAGASSGTSTSAPVMVCRRARVMGIPLRWDTLMRLGGE